MKPTKSIQVTKLIAKSVSLIRYLSDLQVYELAVQWQDRQGSSVIYMPEIFLNPFAEQQQPHTSTQSTKLSEASETHEVFMDNTDLHLSSEEEKVPILQFLGMSNSRKAKSVLDYDQHMLSPEV